MKAKKVINFIFNCLAIVLFLGAGIFTIIMKAVSEEYTGLILGIILLVASSAKILTYFMRLGFKTATNMTLVGGIAMVVLAIIFFLDKFDLVTLCLTWGVMEIVMGLIELQVDIFAARKEKLAIGEIVIDIGTITFGVLLTIHLEEGLNAHLIFMGLSFMMYAALYTLELIIETKHHKEKEIEEQK